MAVVVTAASGFDLGYVWKNQASHSTPERSAGGYYINAAQSGEPPGRWWGPGAEALGFTQAQQVDCHQYEQVYRQFDPRTGQKLGRSRPAYTTFEDHLARLTAAEPHATAERLLELEREAAQATRQAPVYTELTVSFSKSISVFHGSIRENERRVRLAGDHAEAARWADREQRYQETLQAANRAGLEYVQQWAGMTRTGYHGARIDGHEPGRFEEALITVTSWLQGTSRDGDPQDHSHNQIARLVKTVSDGKYRALDTVCLRQILGAVQAIVATHVECGLTREFGVEWVPCQDGCGNEIAGITQAQMDEYSSRTIAITRQLPAAVASWTAKYGRAPNKRELLYIRQAVTMTTRHGKDQAVIDWDALTERWDSQLGGQLAAIAPSVSSLPAAQRSIRARAGAHAHASHATRRNAHAVRRDAYAHATPPRTHRPTREQLIHAVQRALTLTQQAHATWTRADLLKQLALVLPPETRHLPPGEAVALLNQLSDEALAGHPDQLVCLEAPEWPPVPAYLRRDLDGRSVYTRPGTTRYATRVQLSMEERLVHASRQGTASWLTSAQAAFQLNADPKVLEDQLHGRHRPHQPERRCQGPATGLRLDQNAAIYHAPNIAPHGRDPDRPSRKRQDPRPGSRSPRPIDAGIGRSSASPPRKPHATSSLKRA